MRFYLLAAIAIAGLAAAGCSAKARFDLSGPTENESAPPANAQASQPRTFGWARERISVHVVRPGETLTTIAERYGTTPARLSSANGRTSDPPLPGQRLVIPATN